MQRRAFLIACSSGAVASRSRCPHWHKVARRAALLLTRWSRTWSPGIGSSRWKACSTRWGTSACAISARPDRFLLARSMAPELVTAADILEYDLDGNAVDARDRTSYLERFIHSEIYRARPDVRAVVHCHTASLIPFADSDVPLRAMYHMAAFVAEGVPVFDIRKAAGVTDLLVRDAALGKALAKSLGQKSAALMRGHGAVVVAASIPNVVGRSIYLDVNAKAQAQAIALGGKITYVEADEAKLRMSDTNEYSRAWDLWKRKVTR